MTRVLLVRKGARALEARTMGESARDAVKAARAAAEKEVESSAYPDVPKWRAKNEGTRWAKVSAGEWEEMQKKRRQALHAGAGLVSLQFIADQFVHTSASFALFLGLTARMIWLRKHRRRRGARERRGSRPHPAQLIPFRLISIRRNSAPSSSIQSDARSLAPPPHPASRPDGRRVHRVGVPGRGPRGAHPKGGARARLPAAAVPARRLVAGETDCFPYGPRSRVARRFSRTSGLLPRDASLTL
jgi:hypothetical protein